MAFIISKPLEIKILHDFVQPQTDQYKASLLNSYEKQLNKLTENDVSRLQQSKKYLFDQQELHQSSAISNEIDDINKALYSIQTDRLQHITLANDKIAQSDFFVYKIKIVAGTYRGWLIFFIVLTAFLLPGLLVYFIPDDDIYYKAKREQEQNIVVNSYDRFLIEYSKILSRYGLADTRPYSVFEDPPFNTKRKSDNSYHNQKIFLERFFSSETKNGF